VVKVGGGDTKGFSRAPQKCTGLGHGLCDIGGVVFFKVLVIRMNPMVTVLGGLCLSGSFCLIVFP